MICEQMATQLDAVQQLISEFKKLPGIGSKSAQRLVFHLIRKPEEECQKLAKALMQLKSSLRICSICNNIGAIDPCQICSSSSRDARVLCIVEEPSNILSIEKTGIYKGHYHVLHGVISPIDGIGPDDLKITNLVKRLKEGRIEEVIVATNPTNEGEVTALYISELIKPLNIKITRIASGVPVGGDLEYIDVVTLTRALSGRQAL